jgi:hypothetical protein
MRYMRVDCISTVGSRGYPAALVLSGVVTNKGPAKPNCWFLSYSVQHNLHDTAEKQDKVQYSGHPPLVEAVGVG